MNNINLFLLYILLIIVTSQIPEPKLTPQKEKFLKRWGDNYGYEGKIYEMRQKQFKRMNNAIYLDYTAAGQYQERQLKENLEMLENTLFNNPHSRNPSSLITDKKIMEVRKMIAEFFGTNLNTYSVVFTSGATGALKLVAETFPFQANGEFWYTYDNHNSVLGIREIAYQYNMIHKSFNEEEIEQILNEAEMGKSPVKENSINLLAFPAESNFSGKKWPLDWISRFHNKSIWGKNSSFLILLDAAAYVPTNPLNLSKHQADFITISFYKMFGWPTGIGVLIVRNEILSQLSKHKVYFGGGTVILATSKLRFHQKSSSLYQTLEDGTVSFLAILAVDTGLKNLKELGMENIQKHTYALQRYLYEQLKELKHSNGNRVVEIYGEHQQNNQEKQGAIITFNIIDQNGKYLGYYGLQTEFSKNGIHVRTGSFCNPGSCYKNTGIPEEKIIEIAEKRSNCGDESDKIDGKPTGAVRSSIGYPTTFEDVDALVNYVRKTYVDYEPEVLDDEDDEDEQNEQNDEL